MISLHLNLKDCDVLQSEQITIFSKSNFNPLYSTWKHIPECWKFCDKIFRIKSFYSIYISFLWNTKSNFFRIPFFHILSWVEYHQCFKARTRTERSKVLPEFDSHINTWMHTPPVFGFPLETDIGSTKENQHHQILII